MSKATVTALSLSLELPEGFHVMGESEILQYTSKNVNNNWGAIDPDKHLIINIAWKKPLFFVKNAPIGTSVKETEKQFSKKIPSYKKTKDINTTVAGHEAQGFQYTYTVNDISMYAEYVLFKHENKLIAIINMGRVGFFIENHDLVDNMITSIKFE